MSITKNNTYYRFQAYSSGEYLNIYTDGAVKNNTTVTTFKLNSSDNCQIWKSVEYSAYGLSGTILKSRANEGFVLDRLRINDSTGKKNDADVYTLATTATDLKDQLVAIESATQGYCKIKLVQKLVSYGDRRGEKGRRIQCKMACADRRCKSALACPRVYIKNFIIEGDG